MINRQRNKALYTYKLTACLLAFFVILSPFAPVFAKVSAPPAVAPSPTPEVSPAPTVDPAPAPTQTPKTVSKPLVPIDIPPTAPAGGAALLPGMLKGAQSLNNATASAAAGGAMDSSGASAQNAAQKTLQPKTDLNTGALTFAYPIDVPPGRNGLTPDLSIKYNSQRTDNSSIIGYGWELSIPYIVRKNTHGVDQLYNGNDYTSSLDGDLQLSQTAANGKLFIPQSQSSDFSQYTLDTSTNTWKLVTKTGTVFTFGNSTASREDYLSTYIYRWMLASVTDTNGNTITYTYTKAQGKLYPQNVHYGIFDIAFVLQPRTDVLTSYAAGIFPITVGNRISEIQEKVSNILSKKYSFAYSVGDNGIRSLLQSATEKGYDQNGVQTTMPATVFNYTSRQSQIFTTTNSQPIPGFSSITNNGLYPGNSGIITGDINGDAYPDILKAFENVYYEYWSVKKTYLFNPLTSAFQESASYAPPDGIINYSYNPYSPSDGGTRLLDINGDGKNDLIRTPFAGSGSAGMDQEINNGNGWTQTSAYPVNYVSNPWYSTFSEDLNGDGLVDYLQDSGLYWNGYGYSYNTRTSLNNGSGFSNSTFAYAYTPTFTGGNQQQMFDINGDNLPDIIESTYNQTNTPPYSYMVQKVYINNGSSWQQDPSYVLPPDFAISINGNNGISSGHAIISDFNNDGLNDILLPGSYVYLNQGKSFVLSPLSNDVNNVIGNAANGNCNCQNPYLLMDVNADGAQDFIAGGNVYYNTIATHADLLKQITLPSGGATAITYKSSAQYKDAGNNLLNPKLPFIIQTVSGITTSDPVTGVTGTTQYTYADGFYYVNPVSVFDRKFAGFNKVTEKDASGNTTTTYYHQGNLSDSIHGEYNDDEWKIGKPYRVEIADSSDTIYSKTINKWDDFDLSNGARLIKLAQTIDFTFDGDTAHKDKAVAFAYDDTNGNIIQKIEYGQVNGNNDGTFTDIGSDKFTSSYTYATKAGTKQFLVSSQNIVDQNYNKVKESFFYYDNLPFGQLSKGNQTKEEDWKSGAQPYSVTPSPPVEPAPPVPVTVQALVVGGGGSGGGSWNGGGGGGGAGGLIYDPVHIVQPQSYIITVGDGGAGPQTNGGASVFDNITAGGGGGGGSSNTAGNNVSDGSGGGGSGSGAPGIGGAHGHNGGGSSGNFYPGSGGGGAGSVGLNSVGSSGGTGGNGTANSISGSSVFYAGGGGGGMFGYSAVAAGGTGGGGNGATILIPGVAGAPNTGSGGGGGGRPGVIDSGAGGSGIVVISYPTGSLTATGGTITTSAGNTIHTFYSSGTLTITAIPVQIQITPPPPPPHAGAYVTTQKTYTTYGLITQSTDANGKVTKYVYDSFNLYPATVTNALNQADKFTYDYSSGKVTQKTDSNNRVYQNTYDGFDRLIEEKQPDLAAPSVLVTKTKYIYTDIPNAQSVHKTDYLDSTTAKETYQYFDGLGRLIQQRVEAEGGNYEATDKVYDNRGLLSKESLPYFASSTARSAPTAVSELYTTYVYDPVGRVTQTVNNIGTVANTYNDWKLTVTDANGKTKDLYKDAYGNLVQVDEHNSGNTYSTYYIYDYLGDLTKITDALGNVRNFTYDGLGRRLSAQDLHDPSDTSFGSWAYAYDNAGNLVQLINPNNQTINFTFDGLNRKLTEDYTGQDGTEVTYTYDLGTDGIGRLTGINTPDLSQTNTYNALGGLKSEAKTIDSKNYVTRYDYDRQGNQITITNPDSSAIKYNYNSAGLLESAQRKESTDPSFINVINNYDYFPTEQSTTIAYANGTTTTNTYDPAKLYRLSKKVTTIAANSHAQDLTYTYDPAGNITQIVDASNTDTAKTANYTYDDLSRLTQASITNVAPGQSTYMHTYTYNPTGNILTRTETKDSDPATTYTYAYEGNTGANYANPHAVTSISDGTNITVLTYDNNGNTLTKGTELTNVWDYNNRLIQVSTKTHIDNYTYDPSGQRIMSVSHPIIVMPTLDSAHIESNNSDPKIAKAGNTVTLTFSSSVALTAPKVTIAGHEVLASNPTPNSYIATYTMTSDDTQGPVLFTIDFTDSSGKPAVQITATTDVSAVSFDSIAPVITLLGSDTVNLTIGDAYADSGSTALDDIDGDITARIVVGGDRVDTAIAGTYQVTYNAVDIAGNQAVPVTRTVIVSVPTAGGTGSTTVPDITAPVITLNGATLDIEIGGTYTELGATADDDVDGSFAATVSGSVDANAAGIYTITYSAADIAGNIASSVTRIVKVVATPAVLNSIAITTPASKLSYTVGDELDLTDLVVTGTYSDASTKVETIITGDVSGFDSSAPVSGQVLTITVGEKTATYAVNIVSATIPDTTAPVITLVGDASVNLTVGDVYTDPGATALDNVEGDITFHITVTGLPIDTSAPNTFTIQYNVSDTAGNQATELTRTVKVNPAENIVSTETTGKVNAFRIMTSQVLGDTIVANPVTPVSAVSTIYPSKFYNTDGTAPTKHIFANGVEVGVVTGSRTDAVARSVATDHLTGSSVTTNQGGAKEEVLDYFPFGAVRLDAKIGDYADQRQYAGSEFDTDTGLNYMNARYYDSSTGRFASQDLVFLLVTTDLTNPQDFNSYSYARNNPLRMADSDGNSAMDYVNRGLGFMSGVPYGTLMGIAAFIDFAGNLGGHPIQSGQGIYQSGVNVYNDVKNYPETISRINGGLDKFKQNSPYDQGKQVGEIGGNILAAVLLSKAGIGEAKPSVSNEIMIRGPDPINFTKHAESQMITRNIKPQEAISSIRSSDSFDYFHKGAFKTGYYNPSNGLFAGEIKGTGNITTVINNVKQGYINNLKKTIK